MAEYYDYATMDTIGKKEEEISEELEREKVDNEIVREILKAFYNHTGIPSSIELDRALKKYIYEQYKKLHCFNIRAKHLNDPSSMINRILITHNIATKEYDVFSIVGTYEQVQLSERDSAPLRIVFSRETSKKKLYSDKPRKVPAHWNDYYA